MEEGNARDRDPDVAALAEAGPQRERRLAAAFARHRDRLRRMVEVRTDPALRGRVGAADVLEEAYREVASRLADYLRNPRLPFFLWIRSVTAKRLLKLHRYHGGGAARDAGRRARAAFTGFPQASSVALADRFAAADGASGSQAPAGTTRLRLQETLDAMNPLDREVLVLRHFEEMGAGETAEELGLEPQAAQRRYDRALGRLREVAAREARADAGTRP